MLFCFFKQKTAYEMRISDWSSDVCSSDLECRAFALGLAAITLMPLAASAEQVGSELVPLLDAMERSHPALAAAAASRDAAAAEVDIAGSLEEDRKSVV